MTLMTLLVVLTMMMVSLTMTESLISIKCPLSSFSSSLSSRTSNKCRHHRELKAEESSRGGAEVVEQRKVETVDGIGSSSSSNRYKRLALGSGSDERVITDDNDMDLTKIVRSFQRKELLTSLMTADMSVNAKLARISNAMKDDIISNSVGTGIMNDDRAVESFQLHAAGLLQDWRSDDDDANDF